MTERSKPHPDQGKVIDKLVRAGKYPGHKAPQSTDPSLPRSLDKKRIRKDTNPS